MTHQLSPGIAHGHLGGEERFHNRARACFDRWLILWKLHEYMLTHNWVFQTMNLRELREFNI